jgi:hypothetical protein
MIEKVRKELQEKRYLDTFIHTVAAILLCILSSFTFYHYDKNLLVLTIFIGSFAPDLDHLLLYKKSRFYNFKTFLRWVVHSNRYRLAFELFHNFLSISVLMFLLPFVYIKNKLVFLFFLAFLIHLLVDLIIDKIVLRNVRFWRFGLA